MSVSTAHSPEPTRLANRRRHGRVLVVEDHPIALSGVTALVDSQEDLQTCGVAHDRRTTLAKIESLQPDLILLDITLGDENGMELLKEIKNLWPEQRVLMLSMHDEGLFAPRSIRLGAGGYVMKAEAPEMLISAIRTVLSGRIYVSERVAKNLMRRARKQPGVVDALETLSDRELQVFRLIGKGKTTRQVATELHLSIKTVETHRAHIKEKLSLKTGLDLVRHAIESNADGLF